MVSLELQRLTLDTPWSGDQIRADERERTPVEAHRPSGGNGDGHRDDGRELHGKRADPDIASAVLASGSKRATYCPKTND